MDFTVAIVGRPNVGKSTLFNRLVGKRLAIVDDTPGVTRDRREGEAHLFDLTFTVIDTAGLEDAPGESLEGRMRRQTEEAVTAADLAILVVDARAGITPEDEHFGDWLRRTRTPVVLLANKCESRGAEQASLEFFSLGLGEPVPFAAEHGLGLSDLRDQILDRLGLEMAGPQQNELGTAGEADVQDESAEDRVIQLAIVGRPNVGKSTLVNRLLEEDRVLTGPEAGITRDSISIDWAYRGRPIRLVDTAGLRKRARVADKLEKLSAADTLRAVEYAQVVVLLLDAEMGLEKQDLTIASKVVEEGRCLVIGMNKWDRCRDREKAMRNLKDRLERSLPQARGLPVVPLSALQGQHSDRLLDAVLQAYDIWNQRIPTADLNRWLESVLASHPPPLASGRRIRMKYITQVKSRPPTFAIFTSKPEQLPGSYLRYLENALREAFGLPGIPIRISLKKGRNPYAKSR